eukprot:comp22541_c0_seq54/m.57357 comp22541_c0_seq54/g.57357  ORF comp22541_c0_seq54/g.57357 comp22541_c0_seq54/m.57357 type:complete len:144 (-) comp22541_c0_seq54:95-526(-)
MGTGARTTCQAEAAGFCESRTGTMNSVNSVCKSGGVCGNSKIDGTLEECDDGNNVAGDGCDASCLLETSYSLLAVTAASAAMPINCEFVQTSFDVGVPNGVCWPRCTRSFGPENQCTSRSEQVRMAGVTGTAPRAVVKGFSYR